MDYKTRVRRAVGLALARATFRAHPGVLWHGVLYDFEIVARLNPFRDGGDEKPSPPYHTYGTLIPGPATDTESWGMLPRFLADGKGNTARVNILPLNP